jgi:hypothetical protein
VLRIGLVRKVEFYIKFILYIYHGSKKESSKESCKEKEEISQLKIPRCGIFNLFFVNNFLTTNCLRSNCPKFTEKNLNKVLQERPDYLVLAANWTDYRNWLEIEETIKILKSNGISNIALVGPAPQWRDTLYKQLYLDFLNNRSTTKDYQTPYRMDFGLNPNFYSIEAKLKVIASNLQVPYLSVVDVLCNSSGCITRFGESADSLSSFDGGHLTKTASEYVVQRFIGK